MYAACTALYWEMIQQDQCWLQSLPPEERATEMRKRKLTRLRAKDERMQRRLARHRAAIWKRLWGLAGGWFLFLVATPLAIFVVSELWKLALHSVTG